LAFDAKKNNVSEFHIEMVHPIEEETVVVDLSFIDINQTIEFEALQLQW